MKLIVDARHAGRHRGRPRRRLPHTSPVSSPSRRPSAWRRRSLRSLATLVERGARPDRHRPRQRPHPRPVDRRRPRVLRGPALLRHPAPRAAGGPLPPQQHRQRPAQHRAERRLLVAMAGLLFTLHWSVGLIVVARGHPRRAGALALLAPLYHWQRRRPTTERQSWYAHWLLTDGTHAKEIRLFGLGDLFRAWYRDLRRCCARERIGIARPALAGRLRRRRRRRARRLRHLRLHRLAHHHGAITLGHRW